MRELIKGYFSATGYRDFGRVPVPLDGRGIEDPVYIFEYVPELGLLICAWAYGGLFFTAAIDLVRVLRPGEVWVLDGPKP